MNSLAITDALLFCCATWLTFQTNIKLSSRLACGLIAIPALLGALRFSGIYPLERWHQLFSILSASAALPLLALSAAWPSSVVAQQKRFTLIFLGGATLLGLLISGIGKLRIYDQALALISMFVLLKVFVTKRDYTGVAGCICMLTGSLLFVSKMHLEGLLLPGDLLHLGMAIGLILVVRRPTFLHSH